MCEYFNYEVKKLERSRIMNVSLKGIPLGEWRDLTDQELDHIFLMIEKSSSETNKVKVVSKSKNKIPPAAKPVLKPRSSGSKPSLFGKSKPKNNSGSRGASKTKGKH